MDWSMIETISIAALVSALLIIAEHYFPWRVVLHGKRLPRIAAYTLGTLAVLLPFTYWLIKQPNCLSHIAAANALWVVTVVAGAACIGCYALDKALEYRSRALDAEEREARFRENMGMSSDGSN